jgi:hypothetical protein
VRSPSAAPRTRRCRRDLRGPGRPVRGTPGQQRRCLAVLPGRGAGQREPLHDESPDELGQGREDVQDQPAARGGGVQRHVPGPDPVPRRRRPATMVIRSCRDRASRSRPGTTRASPAQRQPGHAASPARATVLPGCLPATIRMQPASIRARACRSRFCPAVDTRACLISAPARFAGPGGERVVLIGDGEVGRVRITRNRTESGSAAVVRHSGVSTPFFRHSPPAEN